MSKLNVTDGQWLQRLKEKFQYKRQLARYREEALFGIFDGPLTEEERFCLQFLYAYMPLHDMADYDGAYFLKHVRRTLETRDLAPWGERIPQDVFLNFVLPYRVNNENMDDSRHVIFGELFDRVKNKSMTEAILETNYWCHEKATYIGTDMRTVSPLTLMRTALGRCGEQSTLAVAALRSVGIPARQCYTPRWAHCDSNHAWVEAWADGEWHFLGACEPEVRLDEGWFRAPSRRAMLVNTRVAADYIGPEETCSDHPWYTEINLLGNYAPRKTITVRVVTEAGEPAQAEVQFQLYNFAEFSTIAALPTDSLGRASFTTGYGDLVIHARGEQGWGCRKIAVGDTEECDIVLRRGAPQAGTLEWDMASPPELAESGGDEAGEEERRIHDRRIQHGTATRAAYEATFWTAAQAEELAREIGLPEKRVKDILLAARGGSAEMAAFLKAQTPVHGEWALKLLESLRSKDLHDTMQPTLVEHLEGAMPFKDQAGDDRLFADYVLCPRVHFEMIAPYRAFFRQQFTPDEQAQYRTEPQALADRLGREIGLVHGMDRYAGMATPAGAYRLKRTDRLSRDICFVAAARSLGIPARLDPLHADPEYWAGGQWIRAEFPAEAGQAEAAAAEEAIGKGGIRFGRGEGGPEAAYYHNFTIARLEDGLYRTLTFPFGEKEMYGKTIDVPAGDYRLTTGVRLTDGTVLARLTFFTVPAGSVVPVTIAFRQEQIEVPVLSRLAPEQLGPLDIPAEGAVLAWLDPEREPSKHLARELRQLQAELDAWGGRIELRVEEHRNRGPFSLEGMPQRTRYAVDEAGADLQAIQPSLPGWNGNEFPLVFVIDRELRLRYLSQGYKLGIVEEIVKVLKHI